MALFGITTVILLIAFAGLAVGVIFSKEKELKGSCGGPDVNPECCQKCPDKQACDDVGEMALDVPPVPKREAPSALAQHP